MKTLIKKDGPLSFYFEPVEESMQLSELFPEETQRQLSALNRSLEKGHSVLFVAAVIAEHEKTGIELGSDYLGGCFYKSYQDFIDNSEYIPDMINSARLEAAKTLKLLGA